MKDQHNGQESNDAQSHIDKSIEELIISLRQQNKLLTAYYKKLEKHPPKTTKKE